MYSYPAISSTKYVGKKEYDNEDNVVVVFAADENIALGLYVSVYTLLNNISKRTNYSVVVVDGGISVSSTEKVKMLFEKHENADIEFIEAPTYRLKNLADPDRVGRSAYLVLLIPDIIDKNIKKFIYVDSDVLVDEDVKMLYDVKIKDSIVMAVQEYLSATMLHASQVTDLPDIIECNPEDPYFNSGLMLVDAEEWRSNRITEKAMNILSKYPNRLTVDDQDALNGVLYDQWSLLDPKWNIQLHWKMEEEHWGYSTRVPKIQGIRSIGGEYNILKKRGIFHFNNRPKPWSIGYIGPFREKYRSIIKESNWLRSTEQKAWMVKDLLKYYIKVLMKKIYVSKAYKATKYMYSIIIKIKNKKW